MNKNSVKVALNIRRLSGPDKVNKTGIITTAISNNPGVFKTPKPSLAEIKKAAGDFSIAIAEAADGGKVKTAIMHDKESVLMNLLTRLAYYVEETADGDEAIIHLAGMELRKSGKPSRADFDIKQGNTRGSVNLRVKARTKTIYKWQYCSDPAANNWVLAGHSDVSSTTITNIKPGLYWFRVIFVDGTGEHETTPVSFAVN